MLFFIRFIFCALIITLAAFCSALPVNASAVATAHSQPLSTETTHQERLSDLANDYSVELLDESDGFISSEIYSIIQDGKGLLWFGTGENGIMRYDGRKIKIFDYDAGKLNGLSHNDAGNLSLDSQGNIWIGTWGGGANLYESRTGKFTTFQYDENRSDSLPSNRIQSFYDDQGTIWLGSYADGFSQYLGGDQFKRYRKAQGHSQGLSHNRVWDIEGHDAEHLWLATSFGLNLFNKKNQTYTHYFPEPDNPSPTGGNEIRNILKTSKGLLFIGTQAGAYLFNHETSRFKAIHTEDNRMLGQVNSMIEDQDGYIWLVSSKGLFRLSSDKMHVRQFTLDYDSGLRIVFEDSSGAIWVTSEVHGIYKVIPHRKFKTINNKLLLAPNAIAVDHDDNLLIVSAESSLYRWSIEEQKLEVLATQLFSEKSGYESNRLLERPIMHYAGDNILWIAQDEGLAKFNLQTSEVSLITYPKSAPLHKQFRELRALSMDSNGILWVGTYKNGIYLYNPENKSFKHLPSDSGLTHPEVQTIFRDAADNMWVGTGDGLNRWDDIAQKFITFKQISEDKTSLLGKIIQDIHQSPDGNIWVATQKGLNLYQPKSDSFRHFGRKNGLPTALIRAIEDDNNGNLWLTTNKGISMLNPRTGDVVNFDSYDGLRGLNYYANSLVKAGEETIFTSSQRGIEFFNLATMENTFRDYNVVLTGFNKMGQATLLDKPYAYITDIELSYLDYFFSFEFSILDFSSPSNNQYAYKLEGYDENWIEIGNRNVASFTNLDGGDYRLLVKATDSHGKWGSQFLTINLHVSPPPWQTWWAYSLYIFTVLLITSLFIVFRTRKQQLEIARQKQFVLTLEQQVAEKTASLKAQAKDLTKANKKLEHLSYQDGLTGLFNRRYFDQNLQKELNRHYRQQEPLSLIMCDIDHFKAFNDFYGHVAGDHCLKQVAQCLQVCAGRVSDASCRYGGEEFAIILPHTSKAQAHYVAEQLRHAIESLEIVHEKSETSLYITMTLGVVTMVPELSTSFESIVCSADKALYKGKSQGRNQVFQVD